MSERLTLTIQVDNQPIAAIFYNWSGLTMPAYKRLLTIGEQIEPYIKRIVRNQQHKKSHIPTLVELFNHSSVSGFTNRDTQLLSIFVRNIFVRKVKKANITASEGTVAIFPSTIQQLVNNAEKHAIIQINSETGKVSYSHNAYLTFDNQSDYEAFGKEWCEDNFEYVKDVYGDDYTYYLYHHQIEPLRLEPSVQLDALSFEQLIEVNHQLMQINTKETSAFAHNQKIYYIID